MSYRPSDEFENFHDWLSALKEEPTGGGAHGNGLVLSTVMVAVICALFVYNLVEGPSVSILLLAIPGLIGGLVFLYIGGAVFFRLQKTSAAVVTVAILAAGMVYIFMTFWFTG